MRTIQRCAQTAGDITVGSRSDPTKTYRVVFDDGDGNVACTCKGYAISRNRRRKGLPGSTEGGTCRHVVEVLATRCTWRKDPGRSTPVGGRCPDCGGPVVGTADVDHAAVLAARAALIGMRQVATARARSLRLDQGG